MTPEAVIREQVLTALQRHRRAALEGDAAGLEATLDPDGPHHKTFHSYFLAQLETGYDRYDFVVREIRISPERNTVWVELDAVVAMAGFEPSQLRYTFTWRHRGSGEWLLYNLKEFRLHLLAGFSPDTLDRHPIVIAGTSPASQTVGEWLAARLDTTLVDAAEFDGTWSDAVLIDCGGDNPLARPVQGSDVTTEYDVGGCHRWVTVIRGTEPAALKMSAQRALDAIVRGQPPPLPGDNSVTGDAEYLRAPPVPSGWLDEQDSRWVSDAVRATDPGRPEDYVRAVLKWYRFLLKDAILDPAVVTANMMSERMAILAGRIAAPRPEPTLRNLAAFALCHLEHQERAYPNPEQPWGCVSLFPVTPSIGCDEMLAFYPCLDKAYGLCGPLQYFNLAALRMSGQFSDRDMVQIRIVGSGMRHEVLCLNVGGDRYLCSGIDCLKMNNNFYRFPLVTHIFNERLYRGPAGCYNMSDDELTALFTDLVRPLSHCFHLSTELVAPRPRDHLADTASFSLDHSLRTIPRPTDLARRIREQVFAYSAHAPHSHHTYAKYAYQTLFVHRPETYALASAMGPLAVRTARELSGPAEALEWIRREIGDGAVFAEGHRVQFGDQVIMYKRGTVRDRALLAYALLSAMDLDPHVIIGERGAYVLHRENGGYGLADMTGCGRIRELHDQPVAVFNHRASWFPLMGRDALDETIACRLGLERLEN